MPARKPAGRRPRVALLTNYPADLASFSGGVETATAALLEGLAGCQEEFEFHVLAAPPGLRRSLVRRQNGVTFHFLGLPYAWQRPRLPYRVAQATAWLDHVRPDLVHCQDNVALALAGIASGRPRIFTIHGVKRDEANKRAGWERCSATADACLEGWVHRGFADMICISGYAQRVAGAQHRAFAIPNAVRRAFFAVPRAVDRSRPTLLFVGALSPLKRPADLLAAAERLRSRWPTLQVVLCGPAETDAYEAELQALAGPGVEFAGPVGLADLQARLARASALVLPSSQENAPIVIAEAMAAGMPVVATRVGGVPEMVADGETGLLYDPGDVAGLTVRLDRLLGDPEWAAGLGQQAQARARALYDPDVVARQTVAVYHTLLDENHD